MSLPPPGDREAGPWNQVLDLEVPSGGLKRLVGRREAGRLSVSGAMLTIEQPGRLRAPLELAPGGIAAAALDPGPARAERSVGRFPILHRLTATTVVPREEGIEGWLWTSSGGSAYTTLAEQDVAPNLALVFMKPLEAEVVEEVFDPAFREDLAKRSPHGSPTVFGVLLRVARPEEARLALERVHLLRPLTDREVPPTRRRHLPTDRPANPQYGSVVDERRAKTSMPPPGVGG